MRCRPGKGRLRPPWFRQHRRCAGIRPRLSAALAAPLRLQRGAGAGGSGGGGCGGQRSHRAGNHRSVEALALQPAQRERRRLQGRARRTASGVLLPHALYQDVGGKPLQLFLAPHQLGVPPAQLRVLRAQQRGLAAALVKAHRLDGLLLRVLEVALVNGQFCLASPGALQRRVLRLSAAVLIVPPGPAEELPQVQGRRQVRPLVELQHRLHAVEGPLRLRVLHVAFVGAVHHRDEQVHEQNIGDKHKCVEEDVRQGSYDGQRLLVASVHLVQRLLVDAAHDRPEGPQETLAVALRALEEHGRNRATETEADDADQHQEAQGVLAHAAHGELEGSQLLVQL
mmetsp:Transcript_111928/g.311598  ORF Transcript_111928/g.311598 Transcript_111928/m.311598 type:complete len:340 (+) Transcript_111928:137-1156(+)